MGPCFPQGEEFPKSNVANQILQRGGSIGLAIVFQDATNERNDQREWAHESTRLAWQLIRSLKEVRLAVCKTFTGWDFKDPWQVENDEICSFFLLYNESCLWWKLCLCVESCSITFSPNYCLSLGGLRTTWRLSEWSQSLAGEVELSVLEEAVRYTCYSGTSCLRESSSRHMPADIALCFEQALASGPVAWQLKVGTGSLPSSFSKTGSWGRLFGTRCWRWYRSQGSGRCSRSPATWWHCRALGTRGMLGSGYWECGSRRRAASRQWRSLGCKGREKLGQGFVYSLCCNVEMSHSCLLYGSYYAGSFTYPFNFYTNPMKQVWLVTFFFF